MKKPGPDPEMITAAKIAMQEPHIIRKEQKFRKLTGKFRCYNTIRRYSQMEVIIK